MEELAYAFFVKYLKACEGDKLKKMLNFFTGEESIPAVGFSSKPSLWFSETSLYPSSYTCSFELVVSSGHTNVESFQSRMDQALVSHGGFGCP